MYMYIYIVLCTYVLPGTMYFLRGTCTRYQVPGTRYLVHSTMYMCTICVRTSYEISRTSTRYYVHSTSSYYLYTSPSMCPVRTRTYVHRYIVHMYVRGTWYPVYEYEISNVSSGSDCYLNVRLSMLLAVMQMQSRNCLDESISTDLVM